MKGINLYNSTEKLRTGFVEEAQSQGITVNVYKARHITIHLKNDEPARFIYCGEPIELHNHVNYFQLRGKERHTPAIMLYYCNQKNIPLNDPIGTNHTLHVQKISQMMMLHLNSLPIPESFIVTSFSYEKNREYIINTLQFPVVLKFNGDRGEEVWKIDSIKDLDERLTLSDEQRQQAIADANIPTALIQEYIENTHDFRVTMYKHEVFGVIKRISNDGFYNNWSRGANFEVDTITESEAELCRKATDACGIDMAGVDFVRTENGPIFFEVNKSPQMNIKYSGLLAKRIIAEYFKK